MLRRALAVVLALALVVAPLPASAATGTHAPNVSVQYFNNSGEVCNGCLLFTYSPGTTTKKATYSEVTLTTANANPIVLDSAGRATIFLTPGESYKFVLAPSTDTDPPASAIWTRDNISAIAPAGSATDNDVSGTAGETLTALDVVYLSDGSGGATAGRWYKADADNTYSSTSAGQLGIATTAASSGAAVTVRISGRATGLAGLVAGTVYYVSATAGALTSTAPSNVRAFGMADSASTLVCGPWVTLAGKVHLGGALNVEGATTLDGDVTIGDASADIVTPTGTIQGPWTYRPGASTSTTATSSGRFYTDTTSRANVGSGEDNLSSVSIPANAINTNGAVIRITAWGAFGANANNKTLKVKLGSTNLFTIGPSGWNNVSWRLTCDIVRTGAAAQVGLGQWIVNSLTYQNEVTGNSGTESFTGALTLKTTGEGTADGDVTQDGFIVEIIG